MNKVDFEKRAGELNVRHCEAVRDLSLLEKELKEFQSKVLRLEGALMEARNAVNNFVVEQAALKKTQAEVQQERPVIEGEKTNV